MSHNIDALFALVPANDRAAEVVKDPRNQKFTGHWNGLEIRLSHAELHPDNLRRPPWTLMSLGRSIQADIFVSFRGISRGQFTINIDPRDRQIRLIDRSTLGSTTIMGEGVSTLRGGCLRSVSLVPGTEAKIILGPGSSDTVIFNIQWI